MEKLIVVVGPTSSGKTELAIQLAKLVEGEIVSADSRQVYKGMDLGTGKVTKKEMQGIPHHLLDVVSPKRTFTVQQYQKLAKKVITDILKRGKIPLLVGGSPQYIYSVVDNWELPQVKPDRKLREKLERQSVEQLFAKLQKLDPERAATIESKNKRRLIRALEIIAQTGKPVPRLKKSPLPYLVVILGIKRSPEEVKKRIKKRFEKRLKQGMIQEVKNLRKQGLSWQRLESFGLEYRYIAQHLQGKLSKEEMKQQTLKAHEDFTRRQMNWFKKDRRIKWIAGLKDVQATLGII